MIDLAPEHLATVCRLLAAHVPECEARAFGSRVAWTAKSYSDLDLALVGTEKLAPSRLRRLREAFEESNLPIRVDLLDWYAISESFQKVISEQFEVIQQAAKVSVGRTEWEILHLGDLGRVVTGKTPLTAVEGNFGGQIPFVTPSDMDGRKTISTTARNLTETGAASVKGSKIPAGSVMVSCIGSDMGKAVIAGRDCVTNQQINSIVVDDRFNSEFIYYNLSTRKDEIRHQIAGGSAQPILNKGDFSRLEITLPPLTEQKAIAAVLGALDDKIELNRRMNATLEAMARALFQSWFVDFDPVRAKLDGRQPVGLDPATAALFPATFQDSPIGHIPSGWEAAELGQIADVIDCLHAKKPERCETGQLYLQLNNIRDDGLIDITDSFFISAEDYQKWISRMEAVAGDCVITNVGRVGAVGQIPEGVKAALGRNITGIRCKADFPFPTFLIECLVSESMREEIRLKTDSGTILDALNVKSIPKLRFAHPSREIGVRFEKLTRPLRRRMEQNISESRTLATLRDTLLPKLLSGELQIADAEKIAGDSA